MRCFEGRVGKLLRGAPCCKERRQAGEKINQFGQPVSFGVDDPLVGHETEDGESWFGMSEYGLSSDSSGSEAETDQVPVTFERRRANAVCAEVYGPCNPRRAFSASVIEKTPKQASILKDAFVNACLLQHIKSEDLDPIVDAMTIETYQAGDCICRQGSQGEAVYVLIDGSVDLYKEKARSSKHDPTAVVVKDSSIDGEFVRTLDIEGALFGELALLSNMPRSLTVMASPKQACVLGRLERTNFQHFIIQREIQKREQSADKLRKVKLLELMNNEQIAKLAEVLKVKTYNAGESLITQGEHGREFFILISGEVVTTVATYWLGICVDEQEHRRYFPGELFGERAILHDEPRSASITACVDGTQALTMSGGKFERLLGDAKQLQENQYLTDPRKLIAGFYDKGDLLGPAGAMPPESRAKIDKLKASEVSEWFAVYRPTSRDAIAKMLSGVAVGKGLNVKGKSAKKGVLSGFVPFLQISDNNDKVKVEASPPGSRVVVYFRNAISRANALNGLNAIMTEAGPRLVVDDEKIKLVDNYKPDCFGLEIPEPLLKEAYIMQPDIVPRVGWETGRASEPAFMDMNLHAVREVSEPKVVLYQFDESDPFNCRGLLIAYAEQFVKPVVSDFDTFTVGSTNVEYEPLPANQAALAKWSLEHAKKVISDPDDRSWTSRWLEILKIEAENGFHPEFPKYGYGDPTSYRLIGDVVAETLSCGAVRHGAECFNFYFPQELDAEYLVIWGGFPDKPWDYMDQKTLKTFLVGRAQDGFLFPLNPVWLIRDEGWYEVLQMMMKNPAADSAIKAWYPEDSQILPMIKEIRKSYPMGFQQLGLQPAVQRKDTADMFGRDVLGHEKAELAMHHIKSSSRKALQAVQTLKGLIHHKSAPPESHSSKAEKDNIQDDTLQKADTAPATVAVPG